LDLKFNVQGWSYWRCLVFSVVALCFVVCYSWFSHDLPKEKQETKKINWDLYNCLNDLKLYNNKYNEHIISIICFGKWRKFH